MSDKQDIKDDTDKEQLLVDLATSKGERRRVIAVDFDGTCVTHDFPRIGRDIGAIPVLQKLVVAGNDIILYTIRDGRELIDAMQWFNDNIIPLWAVNENPDQLGWNTSRKVYANLYIDDAAAGSLLSCNPNFTARPYVNWEAMDFWLDEHGWYAPLRTSRASHSLSSLREPYTFDQQYNLHPAPAREVNDRMVKSMNEDAECFRVGDKVRLGKRWGGSDISPIGIIVAIDEIPENVEPTQKYAVMFNNKMFTNAPLYCRAEQLVKIPGLPENQDMLKKAAEYCMCSNPACGHHVPFGSLFCSDKCRDAYYKLEKDPKNG